MMKWLRNWVDIYFNKPMNDMAKIPYQVVDIPSVDDAYHHLERYMVGGVLDNREINEIMAIVRAYSHGKLVMKKDA